MYRDRPKSPSFTQSTEDTNTLRAAMSLKVNNFIWDFLCGKYLLKAARQRNTTVSSEMYVEYKDVLALKKAMHMVKIPKCNKLLVLLH